jgi:hypothetical protein
MRRTLFCLSLVLAGCKSDAAAPAAEQDDRTQPAPRGQVAGVYPSDFQCSSIVTVEALSSLLGAPARAIDSSSPVPSGVPRPCTYEVGGTMWTYDFDCRDNYKKTADALFAQYRQINADRSAQYHHLADAGVLKPNDAGVEYRAPGEAAEVAVGAKGLDHNDQGLIFIDDDAPCYVRVIGPDPAGRLELAKLVAKNLTFANAPMTPRAARR